MPGGSASESDGAVNQSLLFAGRCHRVFGRPLAVRVLRGDSIHARAPTRRVARNSWTGFWATGEVGHDAQFGDRVGAERHGTGAQRDRTQTVRRRSGEADRRIPTALDEVTAEGIGSQRDGIDGPRRRPGRAGTRTRTAFRGVATAGRSDEEPRKTLSEYRRSASPQLTFVLPRARRDSCVAADSCRPAPRPSPVTWRCGASATDPGWPSP
jgi:hypothetical protein